MTSLKYPETETNQKSQPQKEQRTTKDGLVTTDEVEVNEAHRIAS